MVFAAGTLGRGDHFLGWNLGEEDGHIPTERKLSHD